MQEKQDVVRHHPPSRPDLSREKVRRDQHVQMCADELLPRGGGLALWRWGNAVALQDVAYGLITDGVPEIGEGTDDPVIAPGAILLRHADDQRFQLLVNRGSPWCLPLPRTVELLPHKLTPPAKNRVDLHD